MRLRRICGLLVLLGLPVSSPAHRLDEYLQAAILSVNRNDIKLVLRMTPGVAVAPAIIAQIDRDHDGSVSRAEASVYVRSVLHDLSLRLDGRRLALHVLSFRFSEPEVLESGLGEIQMTFATDVPAGAAERRLIFENRHHPDISAYLVNTLIPSDKSLSITRQNRNPSQSRFQLDYSVQ